MPIHEPEGAVIAAVKHRIRAVRLVETILSERLRQLSGLLQDVFRVGAKSRVGLDVHTHRGEGADDHIRAGRGDWVRLMCKRDEEVDRDVLQEFALHVFDLNGHRGSHGNVLSVGVCALDVTKEAHEACLGGFLVLQICPENESGGQKRSSDANKRKSQLSTTSMSRENGRHWHTSASAMT